MAVVRVVNDILSENDVCETQIDSNVSIQEFVNNYTGVTPTQNRFEAYDVETGETFYVDDTVSDFCAVTIVNGKEVGSDYIIEDNDVVTVIFVPKSDEVTRESVESGVGGLTSIASIIGGVFLIIASSITLPFSGGVSVGGIIGGVSLILLGLGVGAGAIVNTIDLIGKLPKDTSTSDNSTLDSEKLLSIAGGSCQSVIGQRIPFIMGKHLVNPLIVGSPYHETRVKPASEWYEDAGQYFHALYCVGYGPLKLTDFKIENTYLAYNQDGGAYSHPTVMHGALKCNGQDDSGDILKKWKNNDIRLEILQKGTLGTTDIDKWGKVFNTTVEEQNVNASLLNVQDAGIFREDYTKAYKGVEIPNGFRTNTVRFSRNCPYKMEVEVDIPSGLYASRSSYESVARTENKKTVYDTTTGQFYYKTPVNLSVQWRYVKKGRSSSDATDPTGWTDFSYMLLDNNTKVYPAKDYTDTTAYYEIIYNAGMTVASGSPKNATSLQNNKWTVNNADADGNIVRHKVFPIEQQNMNGGVGYLASQCEGLTNEYRLVFGYEFTDAQIQKIINMGEGNTDSEFDAVEVRVIRLTPAYLDQVDEVPKAQSEKGVGKYSYQDLVKWTYLRTWAFDKEKYKKAIESGIIVPTANSKYVQNYPLRPIREEDLDKFCFVALSLKQDVAETGGSSLGQLSVKAESFAPVYHPEDDTWTPSPDQLVKTYKYYEIPNDKTQNKVEITEEEYYNYSGENKVTRVDNGNNFVSIIKSELFGSGSSGTDINRHELSSTVAEKYITRNSASIALLSLVGGHLAKDAKTYDCVDLSSFAEFFKFCTDVTDGSVKNGEVRHFTFNCNGVVSSEKKLETLLQEILVTGRASLALSDEAKYKAVIGKENPYPVTVLNSKNCLSASNSRSFDDVPCGFQSSFVDEADNYNTNDLYIMADQEDQEHPSKDVETFQINYVTDKDQLWSLGRYNLAVRIQQRELYTRKVGYIGLILSYGDTVLLQDDTLLVGTDFGGRISQLLQDDSKIYGFIMDDMIELTNEVDDEARSVHGVTIVQPEKFGVSRCVTLRLKVPTSTTGVMIDDVYYPYRVGKTNIILFESPVVSATERLEDESCEVQFSYVCPKVGNLVATGRVGAITTKAIITSIKPSKDNTFDLTLAPYNESLYKAGGVIPDFQTNMTIPNWESNEMEFEEGYSMSELFEKISSEANAAIMANSSTTKPAVITALSLIAEKDGIKVVYSVDSDVEITELKGQINRTGETEQVTKYTVGDGVFYSAINDLTVYSSDGETFYLDSEMTIVYEMPNYAIPVLVEDTEYSVTVMEEPFSVPDYAQSSITDEGQIGSTNIHEVSITLYVWSDISISNNFYSFNRSKSLDCYPEKDIATGSNLPLNQWKMQLKAVNIYGNESDNWTVGTVNTDNYGTWRLTKPTIFEPNATDRTIKLQFAQSPRSANITQYGNIRYRLQISRNGGSQSPYDQDEYKDIVSGNRVWFKPNTHDNPKAGNTVQQPAVYSTGITEQVGDRVVLKFYKNFDSENHTLDTYVDYTDVDPRIVEGELPQYCRPEKSDSAVGYIIVSGEQVNVYSYTYEVIEEGNVDNYKDSDGSTSDTPTKSDYLVYDSTYSQTMPLLGQDIRNAVNTDYMFRVRAFNEANVSEWSDECSTTALCTGIADFVYANETAKSSIVEFLSAISANIGVIKQGAFGDIDNQQNYWVLDDLSATEAGTNRDLKKGEFRVGGENEYFACTPNGDGTFSITLKAGNISLSNTGFDFSSGTYIYDEINNPNIRLSLTAGGIEVHKTDDNWQTWTVISRFAFDKNGNLIIANTDKYPKFAVYEAGSNVYKFDNDVVTKDESGSNTQQISVASGYTVESNTLISDCKVLNGTISDDISNKNTKVVAVTNADKIRIGENLIGIDGQVDATIEVTAKTIASGETLSNWGFTSAQCGTIVFEEIQ